MSRKQMEQKKLIKTCNAVGGPQIRHSTIPDAGYGLFADKNYRNGESITIYGGKLYFEFINGYYVLELNKNPPLCIDGASEFAPNEKGRWINHKEKEEANAEFVIGQIAGVPICYINARRAIRKGEEIFVFYGENYW